jgi:transcriptional regulator with XRE-family HTH domain
MATSHLGHHLRATRERRGWARETLAYHAGVSCAAIAQIEAGRRPNPRLSTVIALAEALGVTVEQLTNRANPPNSTPSPGQHRALLYATSAEFVDATVPFLTDGLEASDEVLAVTTRARIKLLRGALGHDAARVAFRESPAWYSSPQAALDGYRTFLQKSISAGYSGVRIVGEPVWAGRSAQETRAWARYESMLNIAFAGTPAMIMCPYDTRSLAATIVADARCTHPELTTGANSAASPNYRDAETFLLER